MSRLSLTQADHDLIRAMLAYGAHDGAIARRVGVSTATVGNVARGRSKRPIDPIPNEIADACEKPHAADAWLNRCGARVGAYVD